MNSRELFHAWAAQSRPSAKSGNVSFDGPVLYSYAEPIGYLLGDDRVLLSRQKFSVTTSSHQTQAAYAVHHMQRVFAPVLPHRTGQSLDLVHIQNDQKWMNRVEETRKKYLANRQKRSLLGKIEIALAQRDAYSAFFNLGWTRPSMDELDKRLEVEALRMKAWAEVIRKQEAEAAIARVKEQAEALVDWRNNVARRYPHFEVTALRLSEDKQCIETTRGARVPVDVAPLLWKLANRARNTCEVYEPTGRAAVGDYRLTRIESDGTLVVGCHTIPFSELEIIAEQLSLTVKETA